MDMKIHICHLGRETPMRTFEGHTNEINQIRFSYDRTLLASCSDDMTARIWSMEAWKEGDDAAAPALNTGDAGDKSKGCKWVLRGHTAEIGILAWCPPASDSPQALLAT